MSEKKISKLVMLMAALAMVLAACGGTSPTAVADEGSSDQIEQGEGAEAPADDHAGDADDHADHADDADDHAEDADDHAEEANDHSKEADDHGDDHEDGDDHAAEFSFGEPGDPAAADRVIEVDANDDLTFGPEEISVTAGETITFVVTNTGQVPHDFTLGDEAAQEAHAEEMAEMMANGEMDHHDDPNAVVLEAGETKELTWTFGEAGHIHFGCHQPGHYAGGMVGNLAISA